MKAQYKKPASKVIALNNDDTILANSLVINNEVGDNTEQRSKRFQWNYNTLDNEKSPWESASN